MSLQEEVEETLEGGRLYCGDKKYRTRPPPPGIELGTRGKCFKKGIGVGAMLERTKVPDFARLTLRDLAKYARMVKVPGYGSMRRADLIAELDERREAVREAIAAQARADLRGSGMSGGQLLSSCCGGAKAHFDEYKDILEHLSSV